MIKSLLLFVAVDIVTRAAHYKNADGSILVIFSGIALYYGDTYIVCNCPCVLHCFLCAVT